MNYTYILECKDGTYYTGWTNNLEKRLKDHNDGKGAKYTKARRPVVLIYHEMFETKEEGLLCQKENKCIYYIISGKKGEKYAFV